MGALSLEEIDARISRVRAQLDAIGSSLADLEGDMTLKLLAGASLTGRTASEWAQTGPRVASLWSYFSAVKDKMAQVVTLRGSRPRLKAEQLAELSHELVGDSVALPPDPATPPPRTLIATEQRVSIAWLQAAMARMFQEVTSVVDRVTPAWTALPRLDALDSDLTGLTQAAGQGGLKAPAEVASARSLIVSLRNEIRTDPLGADLTQIDAVSAQVDAARAVLTAALTARGGLADRLAAAAGALDGLGAQLDQVRMGEAEAELKIAGLAGVGAGSTGAAALGGRLERLRVNLTSIATLSRSDWQQALRLLGQQDQHVGALRADVVAALGAVQGPMRERNELRGRLDAYRAKAQAVGLAENDHVAGLYEQAKALLFTAPCDVTAAAAAVRAYQEAVRSPRDPAR